MKLNKNKELKAKNKIVNQQERKIVNNNKKELEKKFSSLFFYDGRLFFKNSRIPITQLKVVAKKINCPGPINWIPSKSIIV